LEDKALSWLSLSQVNTGRSRFSLSAVNKKKGQCIQILPDTPMSNQRIVGESRANWELPTPTSAGLSLNGTHLRLAKLHVGHSKDERGF
jgi:hypothetical protein